ncbi:MAG: penicillin acylase family protein [Fibrobacteria bacterium]
MNPKSPRGWIKPVATTAGLLAFLFLLGARVGPIPSAGRIFNPFSGFWTNAEVGHPRDLKLQARGLDETVTVVFDKRQVPHIFAQNSHDLFFAQGYVTARDRLWQMEIQARAAAGRLAEILGPNLVDHDLFQRRLGIPLAAGQALDLAKKDPEAWLALQAYADGVNAWIANLDPEAYPLEYKLLEYAPSHWSPINTMLMIKQMQWNLSATREDLPMTNTLAKLGRDFTARYYPPQRSDVPPVIPPGTPWRVGTADTGAAGAGIPAAESLVGHPHPPFLLPVSDSASLGEAPASPPPENPPKKASPAPPDRKENPLPVPPKSPTPGNGSNNFVVAGSRSLGGYPLLANDPHLDLGLPSIWYEVQLSAPGIGVYGVSMPGTPAVTIGFNHKVAWGMTNGNDDVFDWYRITFKDSSLGEYLHGGQWKPTRKVVEVINVRNGNAVLDTVFYTHQGPLVLKSQEQPWSRNTPALHALRWLALDPSDEVLAFLRMMKARNLEDFSAALDPFHCPSQNFAFASIYGDIAMFHHGRFPRKWKGQGRFTLDGSEPGNDWSGWLPGAAAPSVRNPAQGWLFSANQSPTDSTYPNYLGSGFANGQRAKRLGQLLSEADSLTPESAFGILMDDYDLHAAEVLPLLLDRIARLPLAKPDSEARQELAAWNFHHAPDLRAPALFDRWWKLLYRSVWIDEFGGDSIHYQWPDKDRTRRMIREEPDADWFDDITTSTRETLATLAARSFREACAQVRKGGRSMPWFAYRPVRIGHLAHIDAFSSAPISAGGCADCVNALNHTHGPSWRMVVALQGKPWGYGIYPGGQSGNPGSPHYGDFIADWAAGKYYKLEFLDGPGSQAGEFSYSLSLRGK